MQYTTTQLEAMPTEELQALVAGFGLFVNDDRKHLIECVLLAQMYPAYIQQVQARKKQAN